jgi:hypothetical protein
MTDETESGTVAVADQDRVNLLAGCVLEQLRKCRVARVQYQAKAFVLDQIPAACLARRGPRTAPAEDCDLHGASIIAEFLRDSYERIPLCR